ncbi:MAG: type II secretion system protein [Candidatus Methylomirabilales bacterium]
MRRERTPFRKGIEGFSLIEIVVVCVLIGIIAAVIIPPLHQGVQSFAVTEARGDLTSQARQAATRMVRELRNIQKEADNTPNITAANAASITFVDVLDNTITFSLSGSTVQRNSNALVEQVSSVQFRYFNGTNAELTTLPLSPTDRNNVRRIMMTLTLAEGSLTVSLTEQTFLRELTGL